MKSLLICLFLSVSVINSMGQLRYGIKAGLNASTFHYGFTNDDPDFRSGVNAGIFSQLPLTDKLQLQAELIYSVKGHKIEGPFYKESLGLNYINLPVLLGIKVD